MGKVNKIARSQAFLYVMAAASLFQGYKIFLDRSVYCAGMFLLTAAISCQFTKNMALCLLAGLVVTNFVVGCSRIVEGFKEGNQNNCGSHTDANSCASPCVWNADADGQGGTCVDPPPM